MTDPWGLTATRLRIFASLADALAGEHGAKCPMPKQVDQLAKRPSRESSFQCVCGRDHRATGIKLALEDAYQMGRNEPTERST